MKILFKYKSCLILFMFLMLLLGACGKVEPNGYNTEKEIQQKDELILAIGSEPKTGFDPTTGWGRYGSPLFQSTLLKYDKNFSIQNDLARKYEVSPDGLQWTVSIRKDVKFSDGEPLKAQDVAFTFDMAKKSGSIIDLGNLDKTEVVDDFTIRFILNQPTSTFINLLISTGIVPKHAYDENYYENPIGSGPYRLVQWDRGQQIIVEENPYYYGIKPIFKKLTFLFLDEDTAFAAAKAGQVDVVSVPPTFAKEEVAGMKLIQLDSVDNRGIMFPYVPSGEKTEEGFEIGNDVTSDIAIRKAINIGVDREKLVDTVLDGFGTPAYSVSDNLPWWNEGTVFEDNNLPLAEQILEEAGWKKNNEGIREKNGLKATFTLLYPAGDKIRESLSLVVADMLASLGIQVRVEGKSWDAIEQLMFSNPVMMGWGSHNPIEMYYLFSSQTKGMEYYNSNFYSNPVVDEYMNQALHANSVDEANKYWKIAQWDGETGFSMQGDAPWAWLVNIQHLYFIKEDLDIGQQKIQPHGHGWPITDFIEQWHWIGE
ncbi:ABC transporter substrate-binding protein [Caldibacillus thermoamylovorans]